MPADSRSVLFVGLRNQALAAAARLGLRAFVLANKKPPAHVAGFERIDLEAPTDELVAAAQRLAHANRIDAVVAASEAAVLPAAHIRAVLQLAGASRELALACRDKQVMKNRMRMHGIRCTDFLVIEPRTSASELVARFGLPLVLKPRASSGGRGVTVAKTLVDVESRMRSGDLCERFVDGPEMSVESLIFDGQPIFRNATEYFVPRWANIVPASLDDARVFALHDAVVRALGIVHGMVHLELFVHDEGLVFGEVALRPPGGHLMDLVRDVYGFDPWEAVLQLELGQRPRVQTTPRCVAGVWVLHPGQGIIRDVVGIDDARQVPGVVDARCRVVAGDSVDFREGAGQEVGRIVVHGSTHADVVATLHRARSLVKFELETRALPLAR